MLTRIENAYLYILRVVVLIAATLALLGAALGIVRSAPLIADLLSPKPPASAVPGASLGDFVSEKRLADVTQAPAPAADAVVAEPPVSIKHAVQSLADYDRTRLGGTLDVPGATKGLMDQLGEMPDGAQGAYGDSIAALMKQLTESRGTPLSIVTINELIDWHATKFKAAADAAEAKKTAEGATATQALLAAAVGFGVFVAIIFCFVVVKIERNLRVVRTAPVA